MTTSGQLLTPDEALESGLIDALADPGEAVNVCREKMRELLELPPLAMNKTRIAAKSELLDRSSDIASYTRLAVDAWFTDETQGMLTELVERLKK